MRLEDCPTRIIRKLDVEPSKTRVGKRIMVSRDRCPQNFYDGPASKVTAAFCDIYFTIPIPPQNRHVVPVECGKRCEKRYPWRDLEVGYAFFAPRTAASAIGKSKKGVYVSRWMCVNDVPGTMVWRVA